MESSLNDDSQSADVQSYSARRYRGKKARPSRVVAVNLSSIEIALERFRQRVKPCPEPGEGVHLWCYHAACCAVEAGLPDEEAIMEIESLMTREPNNDEIEDALFAARGERRR